MTYLGIDLDLLTPAERRDLANSLLRAAWSAALEETRVLERHWKGFVKSGAKLPKAEQERLSAINEKLAGLVHIGKPTKPSEDRPRPVLSEIVTRF